MRKIIVSTFISMDGVMQAPGGPHEDMTGGFKWGGWTFHYGDHITDEAMGGILSEPYDLLLGRRTYEIFAAYWPYKDDDFGRAFKHVHKYVVATTPVDLSWQHSHLISGDVVGELKRLKVEEGPNLVVYGSGKLVQTLLANHLVDVLNVWTYPITLGKGKKLFEDGAQAQDWQLTGNIVSTTGVIIASYVPNGEVKLDQIPEEEPTEAELARREKWAREENAK